MKKQTQDVQQEIAKYKGKKVYVIYDGMAFPVKVKDAKVFAGRPQLLIEPLGGKGRVWKYLTKVQAKSH